MSAAHITICPPSEHPHLHFDKYQTPQRRIDFPVSAHYVGPNAGINGWETKNGLGFDDYSRMQTQERKGRVGHERRLETPAYVLDEKKFRAVVLRYLERKALWCRSERIEGTEVERAQRIAELSKLRAEREMQRLDAWSQEFVALRSATRTEESEKRIRIIQQEINCCDTRIRILREPWVIPALVKAYYLEQLDSVGVASRFGLNSPNVRQILFRLSKLAAQMEAGTDFKERKPRKPIPPRALGTSPRSIAATSIVGAEKSSML
jgi:hypothetical protein